MVRKEKRECQRLDGNVDFFRFFSVISTCTVDFLKVLKSLLDPPCLCRLRRISGFQALRPLLDGDLSHVMCAGACIKFELVHAP